MRIAYYFPSKTNIPTYPPIIYPLSTASYSPKSIQILCSTSKSQLQAEEHSKSHLLYKEPRLLATYIQIYQSGLPKKYHNDSKNKNSNPIRQILNSRSSIRRSIGILINKFNLLSILQTLISLSFFLSFHI